MKERNHKAGGRFKKKTKKKKQKGAKGGEKAKWGRKASVACKKPDKPRERRLGTNKSEWSSREGGGKRKKIEVQLKRAGQRHLKPRNVRLRAKVAGAYVNAGGKEGGGFLTLEVIAGAAVIGGGVGEGTFKGGWEGGAAITGGEASEKKT